MCANKMDLKQQLVVWKRSTYLLDHIHLTAQLCERLVDSRLVTPDMMDDIMSQSCEVEKTLKLLTLLGTDPAPPPNPAPPPKIVGTDPVSLAGTIVPAPTMSPPTDRTGTSPGSVRGGGPRSEHSSLINGKVSGSIAWGVEPRGGGRSGREGAGTTSHVNGVDGVGGVTAREGVSNGAVTSRLGVSNGIVTSRGGVINGGVTSRDGRIYESMTSRGGGTNGCVTLPEGVANGGVTSRGGVVSGSQYFEQLLRVLAECNFTDVVKELQRTERNTKFGELLPPVFTYFMDLSTFLRQYSHIAVRLGEEEKHLLQTFIEGKLAMQARTLQDKLTHAQAECGQLADVIERVTSELRLQQRHADCLQAELCAERALRERVEQREAAVRRNALRCEELRRLYRHWAGEQRLLLRALDAEAQRLGVLPPDTQTPPRSPQDGPGCPGSAGTPWGAGAPGNGWGGQAVRRRLVQARVEQVVTRLHDAQQSLELLRGEREALRTRYRAREQGETVQLGDAVQQGDAIQLSATPELDQSPTAYQADLKDALAECSAHSQALREEIRADEERLAVLTAELRALGRALGREGVQGHDQGPEGFEGTADSDQPVVPPPPPTVRRRLVPRLRALLAQQQAAHDRLRAEAESACVRRIEEWRERLDEALRRGAEDAAGLRGRLRGKMNEVHRREVLIRRLKKQMGVISRFHSVNLNAQVTNDDCKKIVRTIIREARVLQEIAEEKDAPPPELDPALPPTDLPARESPDVTAKKLKKKKKFVALADERLLFVAERLRTTWRTLGAKLDLSANRMDMIELDAPFGYRPEQLGFAMLRLWRDEEKGISVDIVRALREMNRIDLAAVLIPESRIEIIPSTPPPTDAPSGPPGPRGAPSAPAASIFPSLQAPRSDRGGMLGMRGRGGRAPGGPGGRAAWGAGAKTGGSPGGKPGGSPGGLRRPVFGANRPKRFPLVK